MVGVVGGEEGRWSQTAPGPVLRVILQPLQVLSLIICLLDSFSSTLKRRCNTFCVVMKTREIVDSVPIVSHPHSCGDTLSRASSNPSSTASISLNTGFLFLTVFSHLLFPLPRIPFLSVFRTSVILSL